MPLWEKNLIPFQEALEACSSPLFRLHKCLIPELSGWISDAGFSTGRPLMKATFDHRPQSSRLTASRDFTHPSCLLRRSATPSPSPSLGYTREISDPGDGYDSRVNLHLVFKGKQRRVTRSSTDSAAEDDRIIMSLSQWSSGLFPSSMGYRRSTRMAGATPTTA